MEKKVQYLESNPRLKQIRKVQLITIYPIPYEHQQLTSTGVIYVEFGIAQMQQCAHMSAILLSGGHPLDICFYKKRRNYAIGVRSSSQTTPGIIDARSSAHVRKNNFRDPDPPPPPTRGPGFAFRHPLVPVFFLYCSKAFSKIG